MVLLCVVMLCLVAWCSVLLCFASFMWICLDLGREPGNKKIGNYLLKQAVEIENGFVYFMGPAPAHMGS